MSAVQVQEQDVAVQAVELARRAGATDADAWVRAGQRLSVTVRNGEIEELVEAGSRVLGLRVFVGTRTAAAYGSDLAPDALARLAADAVDLAKMADPDPGVGLPEGSLASGGDGAVLDLLDPELEGLAPEALIALARRGEAVALGHDPRITASGGTNASRWVGTTALANSRGFGGSYRISECSLTVDVIADDADNKKREGWWVTSDRRFAGLEDAEVVGRTAAERALRQLGARKVPTQEAPVVWAPEAAREVVGLLAEAALGDARYRGFPFLIGREGERIGSPLVSIADDATLPGRLGSRPFDDEGVASRRTSLFEAGRFNGFLYDAYSGRKAEHRSTGNAGRALAPYRGMTIGVTPSNLEMAPGTTAPEEIIAGVERGLYLTEMLGAGENLTTGDFSRGAAGMWIEGGELAYPVTEINIAGTFQAMLAEVDAVGNDVAVLGNVAAPTVRVARMMIGGA